eukprot:6186902-Pleurochrysis_carterae.AAC.3
MSASCEAHAARLNSSSYWPLSQAVSSQRDPRRHGVAKITPFVILFDGSSGSSWFASSLDRHSEVFIAGYEPLEWKYKSSTD